MFQIEAKGIYICILDIIDFKKITYSDYFSQLNNLFKTRHTLSNTLSASVALI